MRLSKDPTSPTFRLSWTLRSYIVLVVKRGYNSAIDAVQKGFKQIL